MDSIETRQRIKYLVEHGGLWEQAESAHKKRDIALIVMLAVLLLLDVVTLLQ